MTPKSNLADAQVERHDQLAEQAPSARCWHADALARLTEWFDVRFHLVDAETGELLERAVGPSGRRMTPQSWSQASRMSTCNWRDCCNASAGGAAGQGAQALIAKWPIEVHEFTVSFLQVGSQVHKLWEASPTPMPFGVLLDFGTTGDFN